MLGDAPALPIVLVQVVASLAVIAPIAAIRRRLPRLSRDWRLGLPGLLQPGVSYALVFAGLALIPAGVAGLLFATEAGLVALAAWPLLGERPRPVVGLSIAASSAGVALLAGAGSGAAMIAPLGIVLVLAGILCAALDTVASRALMTTADPLTMAVATHVAALIAIAVLLAFSAPLDWRWLRAPALVARVAVAGVLLHGLATVLFNVALQRITAAAAASTFPLISLLTAIGGVTVLGERLSTGQWLGGGVILAAMLLAGRDSAASPPIKSPLRRATAT